MPINPTTMVWSLAIASFSTLTYFAVTQNKPEIVASAASGYIGASIALTVPKSKNGEG